MGYGEGTLDPWEVNFITAQRALAVEYPTTCQLTWSRALQAVILIISVSLPSARLNTVLLGQQFRGCVEATDNPSEAIEEGNTMPCPAQESHAFLVHKHSHV